METMGPHGSHCLPHVILRLVCGPWYSSVTLSGKMYLIITLRKEVPDRETGRVIYELVKERMADRPEVQINGHVSNHFDLGEPE
ncbi:unnamed protein product [marine sediment metagenome]|uniref:Uncharacterized protein n=1 Tax=marine sediment metagenome TaxID=412755 RepID=X1MVQ0_9ZZZZ